MSISPCELAAINYMALGLQSPLTQAIPVLRLPALCFLYPLSLSCIRTSSQALPIPQPFFLWNQLPGSGFAA